jgi:hypothetical protein
MSRMLLNDTSSEPLGKNSAGAMSADSFESRLLKSSAQTLYGFLCVRLWGTRCAGPRRARILRGR